MSVRWEILGKTDGWRTIFDKEDKVPPIRFYELWGEEKYIEFMKKAIATDKKGDRYFYALHNTNHYHVFDIFKRDNRGNIYNWDVLSKANAQEIVEVMNLLWKRAITWISNEI